MSAPGHLDYGLARINFPVLNCVAPKALKPVRLKSSALTFVLIVTALLVGVALLALLAPVVITAGGFLLGLIPLLLTIAGLYSCLMSSKAVNIKFLWVVIIVLAPLLGPILWFIWGKQNT